MELRKRGWEGLPPPPILTIRKPKPTDQEDPAATPIVTSLGLPGEDFEPQVPQPQPPPPEPDTAPETHPDPVTPVTQSPSITIATLSEFTVTDISDDESFIDPTVATLHGTFYLDDGNVEVLCGHTLFRVHTTILSFQSPVLRQMFSQTSLATAESPNGCSRILSSDTATDFATLLKMIYLPGFVGSPPHSWVVILNVPPSTGSLTRTKSQISPLSRPSSESQQSTSCPLSDLSYSRSSVMRIQRPSRGSSRPTGLERASSADGPLTQMRFSTYSSSRRSRSRYPWHTTWRLGGDFTR